MKRRNNAEAKKSGDKNKQKSEKPKPKEKSHKRSLLWSLFCLLLFLGYLVLPLLLLIIPGLATKLIFLSFIRWPVFVDFHLPEQYNITATQNVYLTAEDGVNIGVWQVLPESLGHRFKGSSVENTGLFDEALGDDKPVVLYFHGNSGTRATYHRILLYKLLASMDVHVIAVDYRGFGDSGGIATADKIQHDMETVYKWAKERTKNSEVYIWGHSLGTGLSSVFTANLCKAGKCPSGLILESPFNNLLDEVAFHPFGAPWWIVPGYNSLIRYAFKEGAEYFQSDESIDKITCPIMILHAKDDVVVPYNLGKLYEVGQEKRPKEAPTIKFVSFEAERQLGHKYIVKAPELSSIVRDFIKM
ncbi:putative monoacylglycerol lipase ABHD12 [Apostichopus japonicus]|uniref:Putative monoacylglycerol lipase ABHD12 n=1 Tax=Stichopus japonicus TaxID=307972 RepID=A0A2G8LMD0_STIJA|nr:putative monoacylglycerol lipase ABHD12 [Apostichopus japonicus]